MQQAKSYRLSTILKGIQEHLNERIEGKYFWLRVEISSIKSDKNGHYYLDLIESEGGRVIAQSRATLWRTQAEYIRAELGDDFDKVLRDGGEILARVELAFSLRFGLGIQILQLDPSFNLGELERKKQWTIQRLQQLGVLEQNKALTVPLVIQRIALIGGLNSSGVADFNKQLNENGDAFDFQVDFFPTAVQGAYAVGEMVAQLNALDVNRYDVVVLIRGGGSKFDLEPFNSFELAQAVTALNLPVFSGIGHETDFSVLDWVAHSHFKTPSAVAAFIVEKAYRFSDAMAAVYSEIRFLAKRKLAGMRSDIHSKSDQLRLESKSIYHANYIQLREKSHRLAGLIRLRMEEQQRALQASQSDFSFQLRNKLKAADQLLQSQLKYIALLSLQKLEEGQQELIYGQNLLSIYAKNKVKSEKNRLEQQAALFEGYDPQAVLKKGYAVVRLNGLPINRDSADLKPGTELQIELYQRTLIVQTIKDTKHD